MEGFAYVYELADFHDHRNSQAQSDMVIEKLVPNPVQTVSHLLLLRAFDKLKRCVVGGAEDKEKVWQVYVTNAARRFIMFLDAYRWLRQTLFGDEDDIEYYLMYETKRRRVSHTTIPPLDVCLVWHSYLMNPKYFYDTCARNRVLDFAYAPFPLLEICSCIDKESFDYKPSMVQYAKFQQLVAAYNTNYDVDPRRLVNATVNVYCVMCKEPIAVSVPYANDDHTGFADAAFLAPSTRLQETAKMRSCVLCRQNLRTPITHEQLRKEQMFHDIVTVKDIVLPCCYRYYSTVVTKTLYLAQKVQDVNGKVRSKLRANIDRVFQAINVADFVVELVQSCERDGAGFQETSMLNNVLRNYTQMNLIGATIPNFDPVSIPDDLVGMVLRQCRFCNSVNQLDLLHDQNLGHNLTRWTLRYEKFMLLVASTGGRIMVPTLDIDLIWHTHLLSLYNYIKFCKYSAADCLIDHHDKLDRRRALVYYQRTAKLYRQTFGESYLLCACINCASTKRLPRVRSIFIKKQTKQEEINDTHMSTHNWVSITDDNETTSNSQVSMVFPMEKPLSEMNAKFWRTGKTVHLSEGDAGMPYEKNISKDASGIDGRWGLYGLTFSPVPMSI